MTERTLLAENDNRPLAGLRVVHAANYQLAKDGLVFFNPDLKMHQGLVQNGCFVFPFSINDRARMLSLTGSKTFGKGKANKALVTTCRNVGPDVLLLGHAQYITRETLLEIRRACPGIRIALWYVDPLWVPKDIEHIVRRVDTFDAVFATTGGPLLRTLQGADCPAAFIPNPVDPAIERMRAFENPHPEYDLVFFGSDKRAPERRQTLEQVVRALPTARLGIFGSLGRPALFGRDKDEVLARSRMALNLNRRNDVELYSSDRIAQLTGNGLLTLTPSGGGIEQLYSTDELVYFRDVDDLTNQIRTLLDRPEICRRIAENGWRKTHECYSAQQVTAFMLSLTLRDDRYKSAPWAQRVYWDNRLGERQAA